MVAEAIARQPRLGKASHWHGRRVLVLTLYPYSIYYRCFRRSVRVLRAVTERERLLDIFLASCTWTRIHFGWRPKLRDQSDSHLVELGVAGGAGCIVTRNVRDLESMELKFPALAV